MEANPAAVREARGFVASTLRSWGCDHLVDTAVLLVSELVTNAVMHAHSDVEVRVRTQPQSVRVEVSDIGAGEPVLQPMVSASLAGRGLSLVEALSSTWGVVPKQVGKVVWFELDKD